MYIRCKFVGNEPEDKDWLWQMALQTFEWSMSGISVINDADQRFLLQMQIAI
jgi:hypothetical protein